MKKRRIVVIIFIVIVIWFLSNFVFYDKYKMPKGAEIEIENIDVHVYDETIKLYDFIKNTNVNLITDDYNISTNEVGSKVATIEYKYKGIKKYKFDISYEVIDTVAPIFIKAPPSSRSFYVNEASNENLEQIKEKITYADNYDIYPKMEVEGEVDFSTLGTYMLTYKLSDSSKNETVFSTEIIIKERPVQTGGNQKEENKEENKEEDNFIPYEEHVATYKNDSTMVGIDISKWQGEVDFEKVKAAGCEFVIIRIGVMKDKDSELVKDKTFDDNYRKAKEAGLKVGIYVYSEANNVDTAISNAQFIIDNLHGDKLDFPVVFDWESWTYFNSMEMNLHMLNEMFDAFTKTLQENGYDSMLYASEYYLNNVWMDLKDYTLWVAKYATKTPEITNGNRQYVLWQNACTGRIDGIDSDVDLDIYYK